MTELSPAAKAVLDAFENASDGEYVEGVWVVNERTMLSAAMRAAAEQLYYARGPGLVVDVDDLLAMAAELDNTFQQS